MDYHYHFYEPANGHGLAHDPMTAIIAPRPIGWISSRSNAGILNLAPYSFFNMFSITPPLIGFASNGAKDSLSNITETGEFVWNLAIRQLAGAMNYSSASVQPDVDEFVLCGLTPEPSRLITPARVKESPVSFECRLTEIIRLQDLNRAPTICRLIIGQVVGVHIASYLLKEGIYDTASARPIMRAGGRGDYFEVLATGHFHMRRPD
jgi:flavin reductase (DIM6/NTAB) family NADH-FMN oxidoreductase RutF